MKKIILIGGGGHAKVIIDILRESDSYSIEGLVVNDPDSVKISDYPILGNDTILPDLYKSGLRNVALGVGGFTDNKNRTKLFNSVKSLGFHVISVIHPSTIISKTAKFGEGCVIYPGVTINSDVIIGDNVIISSGATIDHEAVIEDNVLISTGVTIGAYTRIMNGALLALGSKIVAGVTIGRNSLVYAGSVVVHDVDENTNVLGVPARPLVL